MKNTPGTKFRKAQAQSRPLQVAGTINAYTALMAKHVGFQALYVSGAGVANASYGLPDLGMTTLDNVLTDVSRITEAVDLPLLVDIDTGWGNAFMIARTIRAMQRAGAAAVHIEDQVFEKRCGHRPDKSLVSKEKMIARLKAALDARDDDSFVIMARTDALASEGFDKTIERCLAYEQAGADMHFIEAVTSLEDYHKFKQVLQRPILANMTEFGKTPLHTTSELASVGVDLVLYPLSAFRAMNLAALKTYQEIKECGTQIHLLEQMQTREELYGFLGYEAYEKQVNGK
jgi:methylisocitrate lyase